MQPCVNPSMLQLCDHVKNLEIELGYKFGLLIWLYVSNELFFTSKYAPYREAWMEVLTFLQQNCKTHITDIGV